MGSGSDNFNRVAFNGFCLGKVYALHPEDNTVDVLLLDGTPFQNVKVLVPYASSRGGVSGLSIPKYINKQGQGEVLLDDSSPFSDTRQNESDVFVVIGFLGGSLISPVVLGFLFPEECEVLCGIDQVGNVDGTQYLWKHDTSNIYVRAAKAEGGGRTDYFGNDISADAPLTPSMEISHPSGLLIKIGSYNAGLTPDQQRTPIVNWDSLNNIRTFNPLDPITKVASPAPYVHVYHPSGTYVTVDNVGNVKINVVGNVGETVDGNVTETIDGSFYQLAKQGATIVDNSGNTVKLDPVATKVTVQSVGSMELIAPGDLKITTPDCHVTGNLGSDIGASGTFTTTDHHLVTVANGLVIDIEG